MPVSGITLNASRIWYLPMSCSPIKLAPEMVPPKALKIKVGKTPTLSGLVYKILNDKEVPLANLEM